jgi:hypothetical protein
MTTSTIDKIRFTPQGDWAGSVSYAKDDVVLYKNGAYACIVNNANTVAPDLNSVEWIEIGSTTYYAGDWSSATTYAVGDIVSYEETCPYNNLYDYYNAHTYICIQAHSDKAPRANSAGVGHGNHSNTTFWSVMSSGTGHPKTLFLGDVNSGYVPPLKKLWDGMSCATPNAINTMIVTNTGSGYTSTPTINISGGGGSGAAAFPVVNSGGYLVDVILTDPGSGYTSIPTIAVEGGGGASAVVTCNVTTVAMNNGVGDSNGEFKTPGTHTYARVHQFINKRYGLMYMGVETDTGANYWGSGVNKGSSGHPFPIESPFTCMDYLEGILPTPDGQYPKIIQVETNGSETIVLFNNGEVHCHGYNGNGNKGEGTTDQSGYYARAGYWNIGRASATTVLRGKRAIRVATTSGDTNESHSMYALIQNSDGTRTVYAWGHNAYGQLGQGNTTGLTVPTAINFNETTNGKICEIWASGGNYGTLYLLTSQGRLFACGYNGNGNLGDGSSTNRTTLVEIKPNNGTGSYTAYWTNYTGLGQDMRIKKFSVGYNTTSGSMAIVTRGGYLYSWGYGAAGVGYLGHGFAYSVYHPLLVYTGGYTGVSATVTTTPPASPSGTLISDAQNVWNGCADGTYSCYYVARGNSLYDNTLWATGYNGYYNLGDNSTTNRSTLVNVKVNSGDNATNVIDMTIGFNNNYNGVAFRRFTNKEWYFGGYNNFSLPIGHQDTYNSRQTQDPNYTSSNFRFKNNGLMAPGTHTTSKFRFHYGASVKGLTQFDLRTGDVYRTLGEASMMAGTNTAQTPSSTLHPLPFSGM